jgi:hypothetical protein
MLFGVSVNWLAVVVSAIAAMVIGSVWFGPMFGKKYMAAMGMNQMSPEQQAAMKKGMAKLYIVQFISAIVMAAVLDIFIAKSGNLNVMHGIKVALAAWLGFTVTMKLGDWLWGGKESSVLG